MYFVNYLKSQAVGLIEGLLVGRRILNASVDLFFGCLQVAHGSWNFSELSA